MRNLALLSLLVLILVFSSVFAVHELSSLKPASKEQIGNLSEHTRGRVHDGSVNFISEDTADQISSPQDVPGPIKEIKHNFVIELSCPLIVPHEELRRVEGESGTFIVARILVKNVPNLAKNECVVKFGDEHAIDAFVGYVRNKLKMESEDRIRIQQMQKTMGISSLKEVKKELARYAEEDNVTKYPPERYYQAFVTPYDDQIKSLSYKKTREEIFNYVQGKMWMSDFNLFGVKEKWIKPAEFLFDTPALGANPLEESVSDCSEKANTLASMLRASGVMQDSVRVALGKVNFNGIIAGHAWVEIKEDGKWMVLDSTAGPYFEAGVKHERAGLPYKYWQSHEYPIEQVWFYYNDIYYVEGTNESAPSSWDAVASTNVNSLLLEGSSAGGSGSANTGFGNLLLPLVVIGGIVVFLVFKESVSPSPLLGRK